MDSIRIRGGRPLEGEIEIFGAKNAALPLMAASLLTDETLTLSNIPHLTDITTLVHLLAQHGVEIGMDGNARRGGNAGRVLSLRARQITNTTAPYELVSRMRASILVLGPLLARTGRATVSLPGGCAIGTRPVDLHIDGLTRLGAQVVLEDGDISAHARGRLRGAEIRLPFASVGATENLMMAATLADGETVIRNAAREPEIADLAHCLNAMGADISGVGSDELVIQGQEALSGTDHHVVGDRIEAGTYALAAAIVGGDVELAGAPSALLRSLLDYLEAAGVTITETPHGLRVRGNGRPMATDVTTRPYPGFPTDLQAQAMALDDGCRRRRDDHRDDLREPLHARAGAAPHGRRYRRARWHSAGAGRRLTDRRTGDGDRPPGLVVAGPRRARRRRRDGGAPGLSPRSRL